MTANQLANLIAEVGEPIELRHYGKGWSAHWYDASQRIHNMTFGDAPEEAVERMIDVKQQRI